MAPLATSPSIHGSELLRYSETHRPITGTLILVLVAVVAAPLLEELVFRGALLRSLTAWIGIRGAVTLQALCFGLYHFTPGEARRRRPSLVPSRLEPARTVVRLCRGSPDLGPGSLASELVRRAVVTQVHGIYAAILVVCLLIVLAVGIIERVRGVPGDPDAE